MSPLDGSRVRCANAGPLWIQAARPGPKSPTSQSIGYKNTSANPSEPSVSQSISRREIGETEPPSDNSKLVAFFPDQDGCEKSKEAHDHRDRKMLGPEY